MSRCLGEEALMRVVADLATADERAHLAACAACAARHRRVLGELDTVARVLVAGPVARPRRAPAVRRWTVVAALSAVAAGALVWTEVVAWRTIQPAQDPARAQQLAAALAEVSSVLFSVDGEPSRALASSPVPGLEPDDDPAPACSGPVVLAEPGCLDTSLDLEEPTAAIEGAGLDRHNPDRGGQR